MLFPDGSSLLLVILHASRRVRYDHRSNPPTHPPTHRPCCCTPPKPHRTQPNPPHPNPTRPNPIHPTQTPSDPTQPHPPKPHPTQINPIQPNPTHMYSLLSANVIVLFLFPHHYCRRWELCARRTFSFLVGASFLTLSISMSIIALYQNQEAERKVSNCYAVKHVG